MKTIYILWTRQLKRYVRTKARMVAALGQPLLFLFALGFGIGPIFARAGQGNYLEFLAPGVIGMTILFTAMFTGMEIIWDKQVGFLKETLVAPVSRFHIMLGRTLGGATVALIQGLIVLAVTFLAGFRPESVLSLLVAVVFMFSLALLFSASGTAIAAPMEDMQSFPVIINFLIMPLFFLSGALFPLDNIHPVLAALTRLNPLTYGIDGIRGAFIGTNHFPLLLDFSVIAILSLVILSIGAKFFSKIEA